MSQSKKYEHHFFYIGDVNIIFAGLYCPDDRPWNGWLSPLFEERVAERILRSCESDEEYGVIWHKKGDTFYYTEKQYLKDGDDFVEVKPTIINNQKYYSIGAWEWIWDIYQDAKTTTN